MHIESVTVTNFRCFGGEPTRVDLRQDLTAFIGSNGSGKTAMCQSIQRVFGVSNDERQIRQDDFHNADPTDLTVTTRNLRVDIVLAFPELDVADADVSTVPDFYRHMSASPDGTLKTRVVLESVWTADGTIDGDIETRLQVVTTLDDDYSTDQVHPVPAAERSRIQFVYVPASRDGARQVTNFLRGRLWRAAQWSEKLKELIAKNAAEVGAAFRSEEPTAAVENAFRERWHKLHGAGVNGEPRLQAVEQDASEVLRDAELAFEPDPGQRPRPARLLSDGQRSLLHLALTTASLDIERSLLGDTPPPGFDLDRGLLPSLTVVAVEEPENNLAPFYLSRIVGQFLELGSYPHAQVLLSTHSASAMTRIDPLAVRHFRLDASTASSSVRSIALPAAPGDVEKYVRQAVQAHPELYFARFVILGEGDSEQMVIPAVASAMGIDLDPSFVSVVPLGGRHTNHFWRLLDDLSIPHATLLDLDFGRAGGGPGRVKDACVNLLELGYDVLEGIDAFDSPESISPQSTLQELIPVKLALEMHNVFFSTLLDLDMMMLEHYEAAYTTIQGTQRGPDLDSDAAWSVLHTGGSESGVTYWTGAMDVGVRAHRALLMQWYRYLFSNRSKPTTHLAALARLSTDDLKSPPAPLAKLIKAAEEGVRES
ncbi:putative ATP-dependent endonuclease of OLD family [Frondihabitans sp. PhB188]|uniref:ATP-dependent nuclease n=1 Tax=Frondihabitans sp. PhB188 TaxID=2485200 RepID=UPI000F9BBAF4|nr:AAA family ATPase [Frondihabitans sp. PhB188]ROQ37061.1 putative ATP-dependent endonuclease of OLD family [Frondihabitans sp. PhB188]